MRTFLLLICFLLGVICYSQKTHRTTYVIVVLQQDKGELTKKRYFKIVEQSGNDLAWDIVSLVPYDEWNQTIYTDMVYHGYLDSTKKYYNYFEKPADAFQFLADNSWELVAVYPEQFSEGQNIYTRPIYYFKKQLQ